MNVYANLFLAAAANLARYRLRSLVVVACLVAICGPFITGIAISEGIRVMPICRCKTVRTFI